MKTTAHYDLGGNGGQPAGLSMDAANNVLFVYCRAARNCLVLDAASGKILATLPTGGGVDAAEFNPQTMESFCSAGDGKLTVIKETSPTSFVVEQDVTTKSGAKCSTLDSKTGQIYLITAERGGARGTPGATGRSRRRAARRRTWRTGRRDRAWLVYHFGGREVVRATRSYGLNCKRSRWACPSGAQD